MSGAKCHNCGQHCDTLYVVFDRTDLLCALCHPSMDEAQFRRETLHSLRKLEGLLVNLTSRVNTVIDKENQMSAELDALKQQVADTIGVEQSAVALLTGVNAKLQALADQLAAAGIDNAAVVALSSDLKTNTDALAAAVAANPAPPTP